MLAYPIRSSAVRLEGRFGATLGAGAVAIERHSEASSLLGDWQERNAQKTIPHAIEKLREAGVVQNFLRLNPEADGAGMLPYSGGFPFVDTDLYKTLEGVVYEIARSAEHSLIQTGPGRQEDELKAFVDEAIEAIVGAQQADGYIGTYLSGPDAPREQWSSPATDHELYNLGHLIQAAIAVHRQLGDARLLGCAERFADLVTERFGPESGSDFTDGHPGIEMALVELARETGRAEFVDLASALVERRGKGRFAGNAFGLDYFQDRVSFAEVESATGHAVRFCYLAAGATDIAIERQDHDEIDRLHKLWTDMVAKKTYITGGVGSRHSGEDFGDAYELSSERAYAETCAAVAVMQWGWRLLSATGDARIADHFERVLYNAFAVGISDSGTEFFYDNPLQRREDSVAPGRRSWFSCACCPPNIVRWVAQMQDHIAYADEVSLTVVIATASHIVSPSLDVRVEANSPWQAGMRVVVERAAEGQNTVRLRIPSWAENVRAALNGQDLTIDSHQSGEGAGWFLMTRDLSAGDVIELDWEQRPKLYGAHPANDAVAGSAAIVRGPVIYCVEQCDLDGLTPAVRVDDLVLTGVDDPGNGQPTPEALSARRPSFHAKGLTATGYAAPARREDPYLPLEQLGVERGQHIRFPVVPYFCWANRDAGAMRVWMRRDLLSS